MTQRASIAALLHDLDQRSPAGFAIALHIRFTTPTYMFQTYPKRWMDHYSSAGLVVHDPVVHWGLHNVGHIRWTDLEAIDSKGVLEQAKDFGIMNGVAIAVVMAGSRSIARLRARRPGLRRGRDGGARGCPRPAPSRHDRPRPAQRARSAGADGAVHQADALRLRDPLASPFRPAGGPHEPGGILAKARLFAAEQGACLAGAR